MRPQSMSATHSTTVLGLVIGAVGIAILWATGEEFPIAVPPGLLILLAGALFVGLTSWRWTPAVGAFMGLFVIVGFLLASLISGNGIDNLTGTHGIGRVIGQVVQLVGVIVAVVAGVLATRSNFRRPKGSLDPHDERSNT